MFNMKKKTAALLSVVLLLCVLLTGNVFAATKTTGESTTNRSMKVTAKCSLPDVTVNVVVPSSTKTYLNPSKAPVKLSNCTLDSQIITEQCYIENKSTVPISVSASVVGTINSGSKLTFATSSVADSDSTAKQAFVYFEMKSVADPDEVTKDGWTWDPYDADKHIVVSKTTKSKSDIITLDKYDEEDETNTAKRFGVFTLAGDCTMFPSEAWTTKDGFTTSIAFTFKALPYDYTVDSGETN
jgi:hypothetical protein